MGTLETYRQIIEKVLTQYLEISYANAQIHNEAIFDREHDRYAIMSVGWRDVKRIHGCLIHIHIAGDKVWIERDGTEDGIAIDLERAGIPKQAIVLGFHEPEVRQYTGYGVG